MVRKAFSIALILIGSALVLGALLAWLDNATASEPVGMGKWVFDVLQFLVGAAGTGLGAWLNFGRSGKGESASAPTVTMGGNRQWAIGGTVQQIQQTGPSVYFESAQVEIHLPKPLEGYESIGYIPPAKAVTYIHRGQIENDVIMCLKSGGIGAVVGVHAPGGQGKTELARHVAERLKDNYRTLWVDVGERSAEQVVANMLLQCGLHLPSDATYEMQRNALRAYFIRRPLLVILDDVRQKAISKIEELLPPSPPCACLITSRIQQIGGVQRTFELERMTREQARRLMEAILGEQVVTAESEAADRLAERCKYNPLALEIAARRIRQIKVENPIAYYFQKAEKRFDELKMPGDKRWDMTAIFDLSYQDLSPDDQKRFRTLAIFHSTGFAPEAAARVWGDQPDEAQEAIYRFVNLSLVKGVEAKTERYRLHDLLDEYAVAKLTDQGESDSACKALAEWLIELFDRYYVADPSIAPHVTYELENLKIAAQWAISRRDGHTLALLATKPRNWLFNVFREWIVWQDWLEKSLRIGIESKEEEGKRLKANVLKAIGDVQQFRKEMKAALESYNQALELYRQVGAKLGEANVYQSLGKLQIAMNREQEGLEVLQKALDIYNEVGSLSGQANILFFMGVLLANQGELQRGIELVEKAVRLGEQIDPGHPATISMGEVLEKLRRAI